jgi:hypothetical protein
MSTAAAPETPKPPKERGLAAVPVMLTVMATVLAGLSSSEMTQSMYFRSLAAQDQSKAGSQWAFFQAKRIRGTTMETGGDLIRAVADPPPLDAVKLRATLERVEAAARRGQSQAVADAANRLRQVINRDNVRLSLKVLGGGDLPEVERRKTDDEQVQKLIQAIEARRTEAETAGDAAKLSIARIEEELQRAEQNADAFDKACKPVTADLRAIEKGAGELSAEAKNWKASASREKGAAADEASTAAQEILSAVRAAKQDFTARRYTKEAEYNQESADLYELLARRTGVESDRHRIRSRNFFYAMLCAQAGVTVAAFALARSRASWFWGFAGIAGLIAISFGAYAYLAL